ncbi:MAG TPA: GNAT family N-acetyltransferase [Acidimicrobiales bacterium]|nr:GNAT family N-acetyltransferase [Acidimicrobiales bacterium]
MLAQSVRPIRSEEYAELGELTVRVYRQVLASDLETYAAVLRDVDARLAAGCDVLVARSEGRVLGGVTYVPGPGAYAQLIDDDEAEIRMLVVDPAAQGRGIGAALVGACIGRAEAAGKRTLVLGTMPAMTAAQRLYLRLGFRRCPERDGQIPGGAALWCYSLPLERASTTSRVGTRKPT